MKKKDSVGNGWGWPFNARKAHYFVDGTALCRRWMFLGDCILKDEEDLRLSTSDRCVACDRVLTKQSKKGKDK